jgi:hypothetical protein
MELAIDNKTKYELLRNCEYGLLNQVLDKAPKCAILISGENIITIYHRINKIKKSR